MTEDVSTIDSPEDRRWQLEQWRYCQWLVSLMWKEVWKSSLSTLRKKTWEGKIVHVNLTRIATIEVLKEKKKGIMTIGPQQEDILDKPGPKVRFRVFSGSLSLGIL